MTKVKPQRIDANNAPQVGYVPKYVDEQTFEWWAGSGATDIGNNYLILTGTMAGTPPEVDIADTRITDTTPYVIFYETQPVGNITRTLTNGNLHIASDNNADTLDVRVVFMGIWPARQYMKWVFAFTGTTHQILDPRITASSAVVAMPRPTPVGYITGSTDVGEINFASTGTEIWVIVDYVVFNDGVAFSDWMAYNATLDDDDILFRKSVVSGADEAFKVSDLKTNIIDNTREPIIWTNNKVWITKWWIIETNLIVTDLFTIQKAWDYVFSFQLYTNSWSDNGYAAITVNGLAVTGYSSFSPWYNHWNSFSHNLTGLLVWDIIGLNQSGAYHIIDVQNAELHCDLNPIINTAWWAA